jgi:hypothetical protein
VPDRVSGNGTGLDDNVSPSFVRQSFGNDGPAIGAGDNSHEGCANEPGLNALSALSGST